VVAKRKFRASQEISSFLWKSKVNYGADNSPPLDPTVGKMHTVHTLTSYFFKIHFNIIFPFTFRDPQWLTPSRFPTKLYNTQFSCVLLLHLISSSSITSSYLANSANYEATGYVIFPASCYLVILRCKYFSSTLYFQTGSHDGKYEDDCLL
jgi:hypothetical protein